jgi:hypothetical protein
MKRLLCFVIPVLLAVSCKDIGNSPLKGKWQLKTVERNGVVTRVDTVWYNFQSQSLFTFQIYLAEKDSYVQSVGFRTEHDNILEIEMQSPEYFENTDWTSIKRTFIIDRCKGNELTLVSEENDVYRFIRF